MKCLFKFDKNIPEGSVVVDTTSNSGAFSELSPFILSAPPAKRFENLWQFSKVYKKFIMDIDGYPDASYFKWRDWGFSEDRAHRYPMGKGAIPEYSLWDDEKLDYIQARKKIYMPEYAKNVADTASYGKLLSLYFENPDRLVLLDYDAYDHQALGMSLTDVLNNPKRKMGHAFVLMMMLTGEIYELCFKKLGG